MEIRGREPFYVKVESVPAPCMALNGRMRTPMNVCYQWGKWEKLQGCGNFRMICTGFTLPPLSFGELAAATDNAAEISRLGMRLRLGAYPDAAWKAVSKGNFVEFANGQI